MKNSELTASDILVRYLEEKKFSKFIERGAAEEMNAELFEQLYKEVQKYFSVQVLTQINDFDLFRMPTTQDLEHLISLSEALKTGNKKARDMNLEKLKIPVFSKKIVQKSFRQNETDKAIVILRQEGNKNEVYDLKSPKFKELEIQAKESANNIMIIYPDAFGGLDKNGNYIVTFFG